MKPERTLLVTHFHRSYATPLPPLLPPLLPAAVQRPWAGWLAAQAGLLPGRPDGRFTVQYPAAGACYFTLHLGRHRILVGAACRKEAGSAVVWETLTHALPDNIQMLPPQGPWFALLLLEGYWDLPVADGRELRTIATHLALAFLNETVPQEVASPTGK